MTCDKCIYAKFTETKKFNERDINEFECRRYPPKVIFMGDNNFDIVWPRVFAYIDQKDNGSWCGEFSQKLLKEDV
jgi:hypothetical protein